MNQFDTATASPQTAALNGHPWPNGTAAPPRPKALLVKLDAIPATLKAQPRFVCWKYEWREGRNGKPGKYTKIPYTPGARRKAEADNPGTWRDFPTAAAAYAAGGYDGIGFELGAANELAGVDLDHCVDADTGEIEPWALAIVESVNTYTEITPSGTGIRCFAWGSKPAGRCKIGNFEIYGAGKFLTLTGHWLAGTPSTIERRQAEIETLHAQWFPPAAPAAPRAPVSSDPAAADDLLEKAFRSKNGREIEALYRGDISKYDGDQSRADMALCSHLAFWSGNNPDLLDSWFRSSALMRPKWDERHGATTYGEGTIEKVLNGKTDFYTAHKITRRAPAPISAPGIDTTASAPNFPDLQAENIPPPALSAEHGPEYDPRQLVELLHPDWDVTALTTDAAHARRIVEHLGEDLRWSKNLGWLVWNGRHWWKDDRRSTSTAARVAPLSRLVRAEAGQLFHLAGVLAKSGRAADAEALSKAALTVQRHANKCESRAFIESAIFLAADALKVEPAAFDQRPWLIGFENGTWDNGEWREHRREDFLLSLSPVTIDFEADRSEWEAVLHRITAGDASYATALQDLMGYAMSGASHLRLMPWCYGPKGTGKSTTTELMQTVLGEMAATVDPKKLESDSSRERLGADLWNRRLAVCSEAGSQRLEAELLKTLSGSDPLAVRFLYQEGFTATPRHVLMMVANDPPRMDAYDDALKDRVTALPFHHELAKPAPLELTGGARIEAVRKDPALPLVRGFAAWAIEGMARVHETQTISRAECIEAATAQFWADTDPLTAFWETIEVADLQEGLSKSELRNRYETWCQAEGVTQRQQLGRIAWARACKAHGLEESRTGKNRTWHLP